MINAQVEFKNMENLKKQNKKRSKITCLFGLRENRK